MQMIGIRLTLTGAMTVMMVPVSVHGVVRLDVVVVATGVSTGTLTVILCTLTLTNGETMINSLGLDIPQLIVYT